MLLLALLLLVLLHEGPGGSTAGSDRAAALALPLPPHTAAAAGRGRCWALQIMLAAIQDPSSVIGARFPQAGAARVEAERELWGCFKLGRPLALGLLLRSPWGPGPTQDATGLQLSGRTRNPRRQIGAPRASRASGPSGHQGFDHSRGMPDRV